MLLVFGLVGSFLLLVMEMLGFSATVQHSINLGKFTYRKQKLVLCIIDIFLALSMLVTYFLQPTDELIIIILFFIQIIIGFIYTSVLNILCKRRFIHNIVEEIQHLNLDVNEDLIVLRRLLMEQSDISCSIKELQKALDLINIGQ